MESPQITPEPDEAERKAILEALAADERERAWASGRAPTLLAERGEEDAGP